MAHRGPDDEGLVFFNGPAPLPSTASFDRSVLAKEFAGAGQPHDVALGHRRFSIVELSDAGHQPFWSPDRSVCLVFNGEIYNFQELRAELEALGHVFHTRSDTEVLMHAYCAWQTDMFSRFRGFWALALYDLKRQTVLLARDPLGKAPLYIAPTDGGLGWASEIKALRIVATPDAFNPREQAIADFVRHGWRDVHHHTCYQGVETLPAGTFAWVTKGRLGEPKYYWRLPSERASESDISPNEAVRGFRDLFFQAVSRRLHSDAPWGAELSGGMDSSSIVAAVASMGHRVTTFTVKFDESHSDEEPIARTLLNRFGSSIDFHVLRPPKEAFWEAAHDYVGLMDEPFHAPNMLTHFTLWRMMAESGLRVSLNGAGGDELLAGYSSDYAMPHLAERLRSGKPWLALKEAFQYRELPYGLLPLREAKRAVSRALHRFDDHGLLRVQDHQKTVLRRRNMEDLMIDLMGDWRMNYWLRSSHQSWMGVPMEVRAPLLDIDLVDYVFRLPTSYLIRDGWHKWIFRQAMQDLLPAEIAWRKRKMGFPFPIREWLGKSKGVYLSMIGDLDCPFIDMRVMREKYDSLALSEPYYLWRAMSVTLWWKRTVLEQPLA